MSTLETPLRDDQPTDKPTDEHDKGQPSVLDQIYSELWMHIYDNGFGFHIDYRWRIIASDPRCSFHLFEVIPLPYGEVQFVHRKESQDPWMLDPRSRASCKLGRITLSQCDKLPLILGAVPVPTQQSKLPDWIKDALDALVSGGMLDKDTVDKALREAPGVVAEYYP